MGTKTLQEVGCPAKVLQPKPAQILPFFSTRNHLLHLKGSPALPGL